MLQLQRAFAKARPQPSALLQALPGHTHAASKPQFCRAVRSAFHVMLVGKAATTCPLLDFVLEYNQRVSLDFDTPSVYIDSAS